MLLTAGIVLTIGNLIVYALVKAYTMQMWMFTYHFIIWPILAAIPVLAIISLLVPDLCCRMLMKRSIVERIRTE